jgi:hypothetical protein
MSGEGVKIMSKAKVEKVRESNTGLNTVVRINGVNHTNNQAYQKAIKGEVHGYHGVKNEDGTKYIRSNPDGSSNNNIEK